MLATSESVVNLGYLLLYQLFDILALSLLEH